MFWLQVFFYYFNFSQVFFLGETSDENQSDEETITPTTEQRTVSPHPSKRVKQAQELWNFEGDYF